MMIVDGNQMTSAIDVHLKIHFYAQSHFTQQESYCQSSEKLKLDSHVGGVRQTEYWEFDSFQMNFQQRKAPPPLVVSAVYHRLRQHVPPKLTIYQLFPLATAVKINRMLISTWDNDGKKNISDYHDLM